MDRNKPQKKLLIESWIKRNPHNQFGSRPMSDDVYEMPLIIAHSIVDQIHKDRDAQ